MKAIIQIITYLRDRGVLSDDQINALAGKGFAPWLATAPLELPADGAAGGTAVAEPGTDHEAGDADDWPEGHVPIDLLRRRGGRRRRGGVVLKGAVLDAKSLRQ